MENEQIKKINLTYLLGYIFLPIIFCIICFIIGAIFFKKGTMAVILFMIPPFLSVIWWTFGGKIIYKKKQKEFEEELDKTNFKRNQTFYANGSMIVVDVENGKIGYLSFFNPTKTYIIPANRITKIWVDDGKSGVGFMAGSSRVSFLFKVDDVKIRVNTFTSNQRWRMDSDYILTGISKADMMAEIIEEAKKNSNKEKNK